MASNGSTLSIFGHTIRDDPLNRIYQTDNNTVVITSRFNTTGLIELKVGLLLPFSQTTDQFTENIVWGGSSAIRMAVNEINAGQLIPGAYVTLIQKDSFPDSSVDQAAITNAVYALVTLLQQGVIGVIGDVTSSWTALSALMTSALDLPQCSFAAADVSFSDKAQFKYFFRSIPTDVIMIDTIMRFVRQQGWSKIGVVYTNDPLGQQLYQRVIQQTEALDIQLLSYQSFSSTTSTPTSNEMKESLDTVVGSGARVIIVAARGQAQSSLLVQAAASGYLAPSFVWLLVEDDVTTHLEDSVTDYNQQMVLNNITSSTSHKLSTRTDFNGLFYFVNWLTLDGYAPYDTFISKWSLLDHQVYPFAGTRNISTNEGFAYSCMMMMADGFQNILHSTTNHTYGLLQLASGDLGYNMTPQAFNTGYVGPEGPMNMDLNGDVTSGNYLIMNNQHGDYVAVGKSLVGNLIITSPPMFYDGTFTIPSDSPPSIALNPGLTSAIAFVIMIVAAIGSLFAISVLIVVLIYRKNEIFKAASPLFCCLELIGFIFTYVSVVMMIGTPSQATCILLPVSFNIGFLLVISNMVAKNYRIYRIFNNVFISRTVITDFQLIKSVTAMVGLDMIVVIIGLFVIKPTPVKVEVSLTQYYWSCDANSSYKKIFGGIIGAYWGALLLFATFLAYKTRLAGRQYSRYSECRQMGLSIYNILFSALVGFAVLVNPMADYYTKYYISIVTALWATTFSLLILFLPKLQAFIQQRRQHKENQNKRLSAASQLVMATAAATVGLHGGNGNDINLDNPTQQQIYRYPSARLSTLSSGAPYQQQHYRHPLSRFQPRLSSDRSDENSTKLLSLEEILGSNAPVLRSSSANDPFLSNTITNNNDKGDSDGYDNDRCNKMVGYLEHVGRNHGNFVEVYEADVPARKVLRYFPFLAQWEMLHIMAFPWLGYFTYISNHVKQGRVMAYHHVSIHTAELDKYILKVHGVQSVYDMHIQVPNLKVLELWESRLNQRHQQQQHVDGRNNEMSFLAPATTALATSPEAMDSISATTSTSGTMATGVLSSDNPQVPSSIRRSSAISFSKQSGFSSPTTKFADRQN